MQTVGPTITIIRGSTKSLRVACTYNDAVVDMTGVADIRFQVRKTQETEILLTRSVLDAGSEITAAATYFDLTLTPTTTALIPAGDYCWYGIEVELTTGGIILPYPPGQVTTLPEGSVTTA